MCFSKGAVMYINRLTVDLRKVLNHVVNSEITDQTEREGTRPEHKAHVFSRIPWLVRWINLERKRKEGVDQHIARHCRHTHVCIHKPRRTQYRSSDRPGLSTNPPEKTNEPVLIIDGRVLSQEAMEVQKHIAILDALYQQNRWTTLTDLYKTCWIEFINFNIQTVSLN